MGAAADGGPREWRVAGSYLEACNCDPICPCRRIDGVMGGRSTYGECLGALSWRVLDGHADGTDLAGLGVVLALRYLDDGPARRGASSSTWTRGETSFSAGRLARSSPDSGPGRRSSISRGRGRPATCLRSSRPGSRPTTRAGAGGFAQAGSWSYGWRGRLGAGRGSPGGSP